MFFLRLPAQPQHDGYVYDGLKTVLPDFADKQAQYYAERSVQWARDQRTYITFVATNNKTIYPPLSPAFSEHKTKRRV